MSINFRRKIWKNSCGFNVHFHICCELFNWHFFWQLCQMCIQLGAGHLHCKSLEEIGFLVQIIVMDWNKVLHFRPWPFPLVKTNTQIKKQMHNDHSNPTLWCTLYTPLLKPRKVWSEARNWNRQWEKRPHRGKPFRLSASVQLVIAALFSFSFFTKMWSCGNKTHSVPRDVLLEPGGNMYQCYDYRMLATWHGTRYTVMRASILTLIMLTYRLKSNPWNWLFSKVNMTEAKNLFISG